MGRIIEKVKIYGMKGSGIYDALIDTGADRTLISQKVADEIKPATSKDFPMKTITGNNVNSKEALISISIKDCAEMNTECRIVDKLEFYDVIIGHDFLQKNKAYIDMEGDKLILNCPKYWIV